MSGGVVHLPPVLFLVPVSVGGGAEYASVDTCPNINIFLFLWITAADSPWIVAFLEYSIQSWA